MAKLSPRNTHWLKTLHIILAGLWLGGAVAVVLGQFVLTAEAGLELYGQDVAMKFVDDFVIIPAAIGSLLTGLLYSLLTPWGFFRHRWVVVKWIITIAGILIGTFYLGPWLNALPSLSLAEGLSALSNPDYQFLKKMNRSIGAVQVARPARRHVALGLQALVQTQTGDIMISIEQLIDIPPQTAVIEGDTRERLLEAGLRLFALNGYDSVFDAPACTHGRR